MTLGESTFKIPPDTASFTVFASSVASAVAVIEEILENVVMVLPLAYVPPCSELMVSTDVPLMPDPASRVSVFTNPEAPLKV